MIRIPILGGWYGFSTLQADWASLIKNSHIQSSRGRIELPFVDGKKENPLYLVGATHYRNFLVMAGQSHDAGAAVLYVNGIWMVVNPIAWGVSPCAFSQDGKFFHCASSATTGFVIDIDTGIRTDFNMNFFADGIRAVIPPVDEIVLGNLTKHDPLSDLYEYIDFENGLIIGQAQTGLGGYTDDETHIVEQGGCFFNRAQYDSYNIALATVKESENQTVFWWLNIEELKTFPVEDEQEIKAINRDCWLGWFEFTDNLQYIPPNNCLLRIPGGRIVALGIGQFAQWIQGSTVEEIERQAQDSNIPVVAYWDARTWPRWPLLKDNDWLAIQAYCLNSEIPADFQSNMEVVLRSIPGSYRNVALVCQCYTSNANLTTNLKGLVPVYAELAIKFPKITMMLVFTDQGRATGLNDHQELRPYWQKLFDGITGDPSMGNGIENGVLVSPRDYHFSLTRDVGLPLDGTDETLQASLRTLENKWYKYGFGMQHGTPCNPRPRLYFPTSICPNAAPDPNDPKEVCLGVKQVPACWEGEGRFANITNHPPTEWIWDEHGGPAYQPINTTPTNPMNILIFGATSPTRRSDPLGCHITYEVESPRPITEVTIELKNSGMEPKITIYPILPGNDGRFWRGVNVKLTHEGRWQLVITAKNDLNEIVKTEGPFIEVIA